MEIARLHQELGATMIYVTHDQVEAMTLADRIVVLDRGVVQQVGSPLELYHAPANLFVAGFIGSPKMNLLPVTAAASAGGQVTVRSPDVEPLSFNLAEAGVAAGESLVLGVRPQHLELAKNAGQIAGRVEIVEHLGNETLLNVSLPSGAPMIVTLPGTARAQIGETLHFKIRRDETHLFDAAGHAVRLERPTVIN
jgi:multiple sugar transport system ATP-binding protein